MNEFLKSKTQIIAATKALQEHGLVTHPISCKDWELFSMMYELSGNGNFDLLDMGADGSFVLHNAMKLEGKGRRVGIDLIEVTGGNKAEGAEYFVGDLMNCPFEDNSFDMVTCASVIEHQVDFSKFAKEVNRLLRQGGNIIVSFDYNPNKVDTSLTKLYSLDWNILDLNDVVYLIKCFIDEGFMITSEINWTTEDMVITPQYCSPAQGVEYTFGILNFIKK